MPQLAQKVSFSLGQNYLKSSAEAFSLTATHLDLLELGDDLETLLGLGPVLYHDFLEKFL